IALMHEGTEPRHLPFESVYFQRFIDPMQEIFGVKGLREIVICSQLGGFYSARDRPVAGEDNHWQMRVQSQQLLEQRQSVAVCHSEINDGQVIGMFLCPGECLLAFLDEGYTISFGL